MEVSVLAETSLLTEVLVLAELLLAALKDAVGCSWWLAVEGTSGQLEPVKIYLISPNHGFLPTTLLSPVLQARAD